MPIQKTNNDVCIIGAGIAGLTAGCYLQMNGFNVTIFESNSISGDLCTSWKRQNYLFDGCIHSTIAPGKRNSYLTTDKKARELYVQDSYTPIFNRQE